MSKENEKGELNKEEIDKYIAKMKVQLKKSQEAIDYIYNSFKTKYENSKQIDNKDQH